MLRVLWTLVHALMWAAKRSALNWRPHFEHSLSGPTSSISPSRNFQHKTLKDNDLISLGIDHYLNIW